MEAAVVRCLIAELKAERFFVVRSLNGEGPVHEELGAAAQPLMFGHTGDEQLVGEGSWPVLFAQSFK